MKKVNVIFVLDKSGSMESVIDATISGFNEYIGTLQKDTDIEYVFSLTLFDTSIQYPYRNINIKEVKPLDKDSYQPNGGTALYDAVCRTLVGGADLSQKTLVVIMTDGEENSSKTYTQDHFKDMVEMLKKTEHVSFVFLGANQNAWANAAKWGFTQQNVASYNSTDKGTKVAFFAMSANTRNFAESSGTTTSDFFSEKQQQDLKDTK